MMHPRLIWIHLALFSISVSVVAERVAKGEFRTKDEVFLEEAMNACRSVSTADVSVKNVQIIDKNNDKDRGKICFNFEITCSAGIDRDRLKANSDNSLKRVRCLNADDVLNGGNDDEDGLGRGRKLCIKKRKGRCARYSICSRRSCREEDIDDDRGNDDRGGYDDDRVSNNDDGRCPYYRKRKQQRACEDWMERGRSRGSRDGGGGKDCANCDARRRREGGGNFWNVVGNVVTTLGATLGPQYLCSKHYQKYNEQRLSADMSVVSGNCFGGSAGFGNGGYGFPGANLGGSVYPYGGAVNGYGGFPGGNILGGAGLGNQFGFGIPGGGFSAGFGGQFGGGFNSGLNGGGGFYPGLGYSGGLAGGGVGFNNGFNGGFNWGAPGGIGGIGGVGNGYGYGQVNPYFNGAGNYGNQWQVWQQQQRQYQNFYGTQGLSNIARQQAIGSYLPTNGGWLGPGAGAQQGFQMYGNGTNYFGP